MDEQAVSGGVKAGEVFRFGKTGKQGGLKFRRVERGIDNEVRVCFYKGKNVEGGGVTV